MPGQFCPGGSSQPLDCTPGFYCDQPELGAVTGPCSAGYYCIRAATRPDPVDNSTGGICPRGHYCPSGSGDPKKCSPGTFANVTGFKLESDCLSCKPGIKLSNLAYCFNYLIFIAGFYCGNHGLEEPSGPCDAGYYCPGGQNVSNPSDYSCTPGHYCPTGSSKQIDCASGTYQDQFTQGSCKTCTEGFYCDGLIQNDTFCSHGVQNPSPCPAGSYCPAGTKFGKEYLCPNGTFGNVTHLKTDSECNPCTAGSYCDINGLTKPTGLCLAGYFCTSGAYLPNPVDGTTGNICQPGNYCPEGSPNVVPCPAGYYSTSTGLKSVQECTGCDPGTYCEGIGKTAPTGNCSAGYYCSHNASVPAPTDGITGNKCPVGHYCPIGTAQPKLCSPGFYTDTELNAVCLICPAGKYCTNGSNPQDCPPGYYCPAGTGQNWQGCPSGTFSNDVGLKNETQCTQCTPGYYCANMNLTAPSGFCNAGFFCKSGSDSQTPSGLTKGDAGVCPVGHYCPQQTGQPKACPTGSFNNKTGIMAESDCQLCLQGYHCETPGLEYPSGLCEPGFYCELGSNSSRPSGTYANGGPCTPGHFCIKGSSRAIKCPAGTFTTLWSQSNCSACPAGYYCEEGANKTTACPKGHYCPERTEFATQFPCNNGTFNNRTTGMDISACQMCTPGYYCPYKGMEEPAGKCSPGWYCKLGSFMKKPTELGNDTGSSCDCPAQSIGGQCKAGYFCPEGSSAPIPCTPGKYCESDKLATVSGECLAGYYCNGTTVIKNPVNETTGDICPKGHYCPTGSGYPIACEAGTFSDRFANQNESNCEPCTAGKYCSGYGRDLPNGPCDDGWFCPPSMTVAQPPGNRCLPGHECPQGSPSQTPCDSGTYQPLAEKGDCLPCPAGKFCDRTEAIAEKQSGINATTQGVVIAKECPEGFYCPTGTKSSREFPCPVGTYSNTTGLENVTECRLCPQGYYCEGENITSPTGKCSAGFYCVLGATTPTPVLSVRGGPCPQGTYCPEGSGYPNPCPKGTYGDRDKLPSENDCVWCPPGEFCSHSGLTAPNGSCLAGYYCSNRSQEANPVECPAGSYCPTHSYMPILCPAGTYNPHSQATNISSCLACDPGKYCNDTGLASVSGDCDPGFYCKLKSAVSAPRDGSTGDICPPGSYCPLGSANHIHCPNGTYTNHSGSAACYECPAGFYCDRRDRADPCPTGHYCTSGTGADPEPCPAGTYNPTVGLQHRNDCLPCKGGHYCQNPGLNEVSGNCSAGYYCRSGEDKTFFQLQTNIKL